MAIPNASSTTDRVSSTKTSIPAFSVQDSFTRKMVIWKKNMPLLLDMLIHQSLEWPTYAVCWGNVLPEQSSRNCQTQRLFISRSTDSKEGPNGVWPGNPNAIEVCDVDIPIRHSTDDKKLVNFSEDSRAANFHTKKRIIHPGEVNRISVCHQHAEIIASHADSSDVYVWNTETQQHRYNRQDSVPNVADVLLKGHTQCATYALDFSRQEPLVISGGEDTKVCLWSLQDDVTTVSVTEAGSTGKVERHLHARMIFSGHTDSVEDCRFHPSNPYVLASAGDDCRLMVWDSRAGNEPASVLNTIHRYDINCLDWNVLDDRLLITGSSDRTIKIIDNRNMSSSGNRAVIKTFFGHSRPVTNASWSPFDANYFVSSAEDGLVLVSDINLPMEKPSSALKKTDSSGLPESVIYCHAGHRASVVDLDWNPCSRWTVASVSDESALNVGGGTLQMWRVSDLITQPKGTLKDVSHFVDRP